MNTTIKWIKSTKDSAALFFVIFLGCSFLFQEAHAQYGLACSEYGFAAYEDYSGYCKCRSGYIFQDSYAGKQCVSADSVCRDEYGVMSRYDSLSNSCECSYGYVLGKDSIGRTQCISDSQACQNQLGYHSTSWAGQCKCNYGYVIDTDTFGNQQCTDADQVCHSDHGYYSSYNSLSNKCECDTDYTFDETYQCVKKQNNVYFKLLDINPEDVKELLLKSDYDNSKYIVRVGFGCLDSTIERYEGKNLVVNLGTDYDVDMFDTVVLQDHDQTCSIMHKERTWDDSFPEPEPDDYFYYSPQADVDASNNFVSNDAYVAQLSTDKNNQQIDQENKDNNKSQEVTSETIDDVFTEDTVVEADETIEVSAYPTGNNFISRIISFFKNLF